MVMEVAVTMVTVRPLGASGITPVINNIYIIKINLWQVGTHCMCVSGRDRTLTTYVEQGNPEESSLDPATPKSSEQFYMFNINRVSSTGGKKSPNN